MRIIDWLFGKKKNPKPGAMTDVARDQSKTESSTRPETEVKYVEDCLIRKSDDFSECNRLGEKKWKACNLNRAVYWWAQGLHCQESLSTSNYGGSEGAYLYLYYVAEGMGLSECSKAFLMRVDTIRPGMIRLNTETANDLINLARSAKNSSIEQVLKELVQRYIIPKKTSTTKADPNEVRLLIQQLDEVANHARWADAEKDVKAIERLAELGDPTSIDVLTRVASGGMLIDVVDASEKAIDKIKSANRSTDDKKDAPAVAINAGDSGLARSLIATLESYFGASAEIPSFVAIWIKEVAHICGGHVDLSMDQSKTSVVRAYIKNLVMRRDINPLIACNKLCTPYNSYSVPWSDLFGTESEKAICWITLLNKVSGLLTDKYGAEPEIQDFLNSHFIRMTGDNLYYSVRIDFPKSEEEITSEIISDFSTSVSQNRNAGL